MSIPNHRFVETNGIRMHVAEQGSGPPVVMCHGWPESWYLYRRTIRRVGGEVVQHPSHRLGVEHEAVMAHGTERVGFHLERVVSAVRAVGRHADTRDLGRDGAGLLVGEGASRVSEIGRAHV